MYKKEIIEFEEMLGLTPELIQEELGIKQSTFYSTWRHEKNEKKYKSKLIGVYISLSGLSVDELISVIEPIKRIKNSK